MHLIITGGTIDKRYNELAGLVDFAPTSHIEAMLRQARLNVDDYTITPLVLKDSLDITREDRGRILQSIQSSPSHQILITHGTDTIVESAHYFASHHMDKTIVLIGAMIPYRFKDSDALFNLGFAMGALATLDSGVYVAMNGKVFLHDKVVKNREHGVFEAL
ncbi:MAG: asparaginase domain-containing protein [Campylobacterota bacterium]|nr:asparaginase domain-containing protein [Campylobacterota bacterium]